MRGKRFAAALFGANLCFLSGGAVMASAAEVQETRIQLSDEEILVDGEAISQDPSSPVYAGAEMVYYEEGQDSTYGEGGEGDAHSVEEASGHLVITIAQPGTYRVAGSVSRGQIAVDLGEDSRGEEDAAVNLILDGADITCTAAPAIVVYNAYECGSADTETAAKEVDTDQAGFTLTLADDSENHVSGSHVAKIYREGTTQEEVDSGEAKKAWKFDAAIDSMVSMEINAEEKGNGKLAVEADKEGIESALHLTVNGGEITVRSADDALNASEDGVSVITVNGGAVFCDSGSGSEGDGIDSNGWIVINGGFVNASANGESQDSGIDSDLGIYINGGTVAASGNMYDEVSADSAQHFMVFSFSEKAEAGQLFLLKDGSGEPVIAFGADNPFQTMVLSIPELAEGDYTLYKAASVTGTRQGSIYTDITACEGEVQLAYRSTSLMGGPMMGGGPGQEGGFRPDRGDRPENMDGNMPEAGQMEPPEGAENGGAEGGQMEPPEGVENGGSEVGQVEPPESAGDDGSEVGQVEPPESAEDDGSEVGQVQPPENMEQGEMPEGAGRREMPEGMGGQMNSLEEPQTVFSLSSTGYIFAQISEA